MAIKISKALLSVILLLVLSSAMPTQHYLPEGVASSDVLLSQSSNGKQIIAVVTKAELRIYKQEKGETYSLMSSKPICQASSLTLSQNGILRSGLKSASTYNVVVGCHDGYFYIYQVSPRENGIVKSFAKKLNQPVAKMLTALPYLFISTTSQIEVFNLNNNQLQQVIPMNGGVVSFFKNLEDNRISASDFNSELEIMITNRNKIQINRKELTKVNNILLIKGRLLQNTNPNVTELCGNGDPTDPGEQCDDGNVVSGDGCSSTCQREYCGDGTVNNNPGTVINEQCDPGATELLTSKTCNSTCGFYCGDGVTNQTLGQACDDGNQINGDGCQTNCQRTATTSYAGALGGGLAVGFAGVVGVIASTAVGNTTSVASSLIGIGPMAAVAGGGAPAAVATNVAQAVGQGVSQGVGQGVGQGASQGLALGKAL